MERLSVSMLLRYGVITFPHLNASGQDGMIVKASLKQEDDASVSR